jgi:hypothetical protein
MGDDDFFLQTLINSIDKFYNEWYCPEKSFNKEIEKVKLNILIEQHIRVLLLYYDKERFVNCKDLYKERVNFLTEIQQIINILRGV